MWRLGILIVALTGTVAHAEPAYVERPVVLPNGVLEGGVVGETFQAEDESNRYVYGTLGAALRYGFGRAEVEGGVTFQTLLTADDSSYRPLFEREAFRSVYAAGRVLIAAETAIALRVDARTPTSEYAQDYVAGAFLEHKWHPSTSTYVQGVAGGSYMRSYTHGTDFSNVTNAADFVAGIRGAVQIVPTVAIEGGVTLEQVESEHADTANSSRLSVGVVWSVTPALDVIASAEHSSAEVGEMSVGTGDFPRGGTSFSVGVVARKIP